MSRNPVFDWLSVIVSGHLLLNGVSLLLVGLGVLISSLIHPVLGMVSILLLGISMIFAFPKFACRVVFRGRSKGQERGEGYLLLLGLAAMALVIFGFFIGGGLVEFLNSEVVEGLAPADLPEYRGRNVFFHLADHNIVHRLSGKYFESRRGPDKVSRTSRYYVAPLVHGDLSVAQIDDLNQRGEFCVWVTNEASHLFFYEIAPSTGYVKAVSKALKGRQPGCEPLFLFSYESPSAAAERNTRLLKLVFLLANLIPLLLAGGYGIRTLLGNRRQKTAAASTTVSRSRVGSRSRKSRLGRRRR